MSDREHFDLEGNLTKIGNQTARIDERTEHMERRLDDLSTHNKEQDEQLEELDDRVTKHGVVIGFITFGTASVVTALMGKLHAIIDIL